MKTIKVGDKVNGVYQGQQYRGVVEYVRPRSYHIVLDEPISVHGTLRHQISVSDFGNTIENN